MSGYFELKTVAGAQFMFNLKAGNHEVILTSERYASKADAENGIASVKANAALDERYQRKMAKDNSPYFVLVAANGQTIGKSEMYSSSKAMEGGIASVKANAPGAATKVLEGK
ncbi:MAG: YegP family protein [Burkholderiaceae bacterium]|nr:YegP family protein [Burkholderiaceae bacterium]